MNSKVMNKTKKFLMPAIFILMGMMIFTGCSKKDKVKTEKQKPITETVFAVNGFKSYKGDLNGYLEFGGDVCAVSSVDVLPDTSGKISRIFVNVGDEVKKGQVLAEVDASRPGMTYSASPVKAPVSGTVISFAATEGIMVAPTMALGRISSTDKLEIKTSVAERFVSKIKLGQNAVLTFDAYPGEKFSARVTKISPVLDTSSRTMAVTLQLDPPDDKIKIGMYARIKLITDPKTNTIIIPESALITRGGINYVFCVDENNTVHGKKVIPGIRVDDKIEILDGLKENEIVVTKGQTLLNEGTKVNVVSLIDETATEKSMEAE